MPITTKPHVSQKQRRAQRPIRSVFCSSGEGPSVRRAPFFRPVPFAGSPAAAGAGWRMARSIAIQ
jgi:hypothetical protein